MTKAGSKHHGEYYIASKAGKCQPKWVNKLLAEAPIELVSPDRVSTAVNVSCLKQHFLS